MKHFILGLAGTILIVVTSFGSANADCQFSHALKALKWQSNLTQAFIPCTSPNATNQSGYASCEYAFVPNTGPQTPSQQNGHSATGWFFVGGQGAVTLKAVPKVPKSDFFDTSGMDIAVQAKVKGVSSPSGPVDGLATLSVTVRTTSDSNGTDMTTVDSSFPFYFNVAGGSGQVKGTIDTFLNGLSEHGLRLCSNVQILSVSITDPNGDVFAVPGLFQ